MKLKSEKYHRVTDDFKLSVLTDMYGNGLSYNFTVKKYGLSCLKLIKCWEEQFALKSKTLSLPQEVIEKVAIMRKERNERAQSANPKVREQELEDEVAKLRKALEYSELRCEALHELLKIGKEEFGLDLLKKGGAKQ